MLFYKDYKKGLFCQLNQPIRNTTELFNYIVIYHICIKYILNVTCTIIIVNTINSYITKLFVI